MSSGVGWASSRNASSDGEGVTRWWLRLLPLVATHFRVSADLLELLSCEPLRAEMRVVGLDALEVNIKAQVVRESPVKLDYNIRVRWRSRRGMAQWRFKSPERAVFKLIELQCFDALEQMAPVNLEDRYLLLKRESRWLRQGVRLRLTCTTPAAAPIWYRLEVIYPIGAEILPDLRSLPCDVVTLLDRRVELERESTSDVMTGWWRIGRALRMAEQVGE
ncbi:MAG: hypothetical protein ACK4WM_09095 [Thermoflexales bacterium]